ncbi:thiol-disulfide oxidoreductase ResA [Camelliibacillus cellulosilyticus]|uniref:Thiol-disulfide oxidoreductase ResA n=1 Tax=Camelliibacillus cellulosilyticus TaxID=2174486 RepID=A0ABV9GPC9_9BACL
MKNRKLRLAVRAVILAVFVVAVGYTLVQVLHAKDTGSDGKGDQAPNFSLKTLDGKTVKLSDFRGKGVVLNFWGSWCEPCKYEMPFINEAYQKRPKNVEVLGVNIQESPIVVQNFVRQDHIGFPILLDSKGSVTEAYNIQPIPTTFLIDKNGKIVKKIVSYMPSTDEVLKNMKLIEP